MTGWMITRRVDTGEVFTGWVYEAEQQARWKGFAIEQIPPYEFEDELTFLRYGRGRSAATIHLKGTTQEWQTGLDGLSEMIPHMVNGVIKGRFKFRKQGQQIYIFPVG